jgi:hypothetical protein
MRVVADPASTELPSAAAHSTVQIRQDLQLPAQGVLPDGVSFATEPQMYQLRNVSGDRVLVLLLTLATYTAANGGMANTTGVFPMHMHWVDGDWRLADIGDADQDFSALDATPGTAAASDAGWHFIEGASTP